MERKKEADSLQSEDRKIELLLQESFGYSDEQLLKELEMAEAQAESAKMAEEEELLSGQRDLPEQNENAAPSDEFEEILKKMRERGIEPKAGKGIKSAGFPWRSRTGRSFAIGGNLRTGETAGGGSRSYRYKSHPKDTPLWP